MSTVAESIRRGLEQAVAYAEGTADASAYRVHVPKQIDVKAIRAKLEMTQRGICRPLRLLDQYAAALGTRFAPAGRSSEGLSARYRTRSRGRAESLASISARAAAFVT